jgi:hypothetical protein
MPTLIWKDNRLTADDVPPWDGTILFVGPQIKISEMVADTARWCKEHDGVEKNLMIYCHGAPGYLQICREGIQYANVLALAPLKPYFDEVSIHACLIAKGQAGRAFCTKLAQILVAPVYGAVSLQWNTGVRTIYGWIDDGKFDGDFYLHGPTGTRTGPFRSDSVQGDIVHPSIY